ncbi:PC4-domain-containing protein [Phanerochaete sordida]|uniref:PC4-domain-containing protein n=1 Tax=Phanerochaete sordida TaxID=48140 RepID=A0A9P3GI65_9APHY|nr:PC4-domain-containing protein [Phanerochaete sordida]
MAKRKDVVESDEEEAIETPSDSEEERPKKKAKGKAKAKKPRFEKDESEEERPMKKQKQAKPKDSNEDEDAPSADIKMNYEGERYVDLGKKKRVTVRSFKGSTFIDIREYYGGEGDEKPGKKGITLSPEQWQALKAHADSVDYMLRKMNK